MPRSGDLLDSDRSIQAKNEVLKSGTVRTPPVWLIVGCLLVLSGLFRWGIADLSDWGIDEAANLWLGTQMLAGHDVPVGLVSSRGVPNLVGAPMIAAPFSLLPDLLTVSRALSLVHLAALAVFGVALWRRGGSAIIIAAVLFLFPALILASVSLWNQYLTLPLTALTLPLLLFLGDGRPSSVARGWALVACVLLSFAQPAVHLAAFVDLAVNLGLLILVLALRPKRVSAAIVLPGVILVGYVLSFLYKPWLARVFEPFGIHVGWAVIVVVVIAATVLAAVAVLRRAGSRVEKVGSAVLASRYLSWLILAALVFCVAVSSVLPFFGAQPGSRLIRAGEFSGWLLLVAQTVLIVAAAPLLWRMFGDCRRRMTPSEIVSRHFSCGRGPALILMAYPVFLCAGRLVLEPSLLLPSGRSDLLLPLLPALLAPLLVLGRAENRRPTSVVTMSAAAAAAAAYIWLGTVGVSGAYVERFWHSISPSEMREVVDWVATRHLELGGGAEIDLGYDLEHGREWINEVACRSWTSWYSIGRPYDWLLKQRHGLDNVREGTCERTGGTGFQLGYRLLEETPPDMKVVHTSVHLEIRVPSLQ